MDWEAAVQQLIQNQQNFRQAFAQFLTHQANAGPTGALPAKKIVASPEAYDRSPQKFHEWWSKVKIWIATTHATATDQQKAAAVYSRLEGPCYDFTFLLTLFSFYELRSRTLCAQRTYLHHMSPVRLLICSLPISRVSVLYCYGLSTCLMLTLFGSSTCL